MSTEEKLKEDEDDSSHKTPQAITITIMDPSALETTTFRSIVSSSRESHHSREGSGSMVVVGESDDGTITVSQSAKDLLQTVTETHMGTEELPVISNINSAEDTHEQSTIHIVTKTNEGELEKVDEIEEGDGMEEDIAGYHCLICNAELQDELIPIFKTLTTTSHRKVSLYLGGLVGQKLTSRKAHSDIICSKCFGLLNKLDLLEVEIRDTKESIVNKYQETVSMYGGRARRRKPAAAKKSDFVFPKIEPENECEQAVALEMDETFEPQVDDLMEEEHDRKEESDSQDEDWEPEFKRPRMKRDASEPDPRRTPKRRRGRPRKDASKSKDVVIIGLAANNPADELPDEAVGGTVSIVRPKSSRLLRNRPANYKPCEFCGIIPFSNVEHHMAEYHPETLVRPCVLCDQRFQTFRQLCNHVLRTHGSCFLCPVCSITFTKVAEFTQHYNENHSETSAKFTCVVCRNTFNICDDYCAHMETHQVEAVTLFPQEEVEDTMNSSLNNMRLDINHSKNSCKHCRKKFKSSAALKRHLLCIHGERPSFQCEVCYAKFHSSGSLLDHVESHSNGVIQCPLCDQHFDKFNHLRYHCDDVHGGAAVYLCQYCSHKAKSINTLFTHVLFHHPNKLGLEQNVSCTKCGEKFYSGRELTHHKTTKHTETVKCSYCSKTMSKYLLSTHVNVEHTKKHKSTCAFCGQEFFSNVKLKNHVKRHHMREQYARFVCHLCDKAYITYGELQRHVAAHQNERKYKCEYCSRAYFKAGDLTYHRRTHTGERPHACAACGAAFSRPSELTTHMARAHNLSNVTRQYQRSAAYTVHDSSSLLEEIPCTSVNQSLQTAASKDDLGAEIITEVKEVEGDGSVKVVQALSQETHSSQHQILAQDEGDIRVIYVEVME